MALAPLLITLAAFAAATALHALVRHPLTNPVGLAVAAIVVLVLAGGTDLDAYRRGNAALVWLLRPTVVALGWLLYRERRWLARHAAAVLAAVLAGSLTSLLVTPLLARALGAGPELQRALALKSVTSPIAAGIAPRLGVDADLAVALIIATGIYGAVVGVATLRRLGVRDPFLTGLALGTNSHGIGTARAVALGGAAGAAGGLAMVLMGVATALLAPWALALLGLR